MTNHLGTISYGVFTTILTEAANRFCGRAKRRARDREHDDLFLKPVQMESVIEIKPNILEAGRKFGKMDIEVFHQGALVGKAMMMVQLMERS